MGHSERLVYFYGILTAWVRKCEQPLSKHLYAWEWECYRLSKLQCKSVKPEGPKLFALVRQASLQDWNLVAPSAWLQLLGCSFSLAASPAAIWLQLQLLHQPPFLRWMHTIHFLSACVWFRDVTSFSDGSGMVCIREGTRFYIYASDSLLSLTFTHMKRTWHHEIRRMHPQHPKHRTGRMPCASSLNVSNKPSSALSWSSASQDTPVAASSQTRDFPPILNFNRKCHRQK